MANDLAKSVIMPAIRQRKRDATAKQLYPRVTEQSNDAENRYGILRATQTNFARKRKYSIAHEANECCEKGQIPTFQQLRKLQR